MDPFVLVISSCNKDSMVSYVENIQYLERYGKFASPRAGKFTLIDMFRLILLCTFLLSLWPQPGSTNIRTYDMSNQRTLQNLVPNSYSGLHPALSSIFPNPTLQPLLMPQGSWPYILSYLRGFESALGFQARIEVPSVQLESGVALDDYFRI